MLPSHLPQPYSHKAPQTSPASFPNHKQRHTGRGSQTIQADSCPRLGVHLGDPGQTLPSIPITGGEATHDQGHFFPSHL